METDVCIIGAGAAGITLALELIGSPLRVTVLESGGLQYEAETQALYQGDSIGLPYADLGVPRLRFFGGTTNHWGGICRPFEEADFEPREGIPVHRLADQEERRRPLLRAGGARRWPSLARMGPGPLGPGDEPAPAPLTSDRIVSRVAQEVEPDLAEFRRGLRDELRLAPNVTVLLHANATA